MRKFTIILAGVALSAALVTRFCIPDDGAPPPVSPPPTAEPPVANQ